MVIHLPQKGARVGAYEIIEQVGQGGAGYVYKAERGGRYYAIKVLNKLDLDGWTRREVTALANLPLPNVARFVGYDRWPEADTGYPCIIMEFVSGLPLDVFALRHNPSTRRALLIFSKMTRALGDVFRLGVMHRDVKESNVIIREEDGEPILIDFGFSAVVGVPTVTGHGWVPPGTPEYRSPEIMRFLAGQTEEDTYTYRLSDELWALGVTLYWLLTDEMPFGSRNELGLNERVRVEAPRPPRLVNPRVPEAVSRVCLRMLEKDALARFQTHEEIYEAVEALLSQNEGAADWEEPLMDPTSPNEATATGDAGAGAPDHEPEKPVPSWIADKPRRGRWPVAEAVPAPPERARAEARAALPERPGGAEPVQHKASGVRRGWVGARSPMAVGPLLLGLLKRPPLALVVALTVVALLVGFVRAWRWPAPAGKALPTVLAKNAEPPPAAATPIREVARPDDPTEADQGAVPKKGPSPAPPTTAMSRQEDSRLKPQEKSAHPLRNKTRRCVPIRQKVCTAAGACSILLTGCPGPGAQVRPEPKPIECPAGWRETHIRFGIFKNGNAVLQGHRGWIGDESPTMEEGRITMVLDGGWKKMPPGTLITGTLTFGEDRFFGRFTQAQTPDRQLHPICVQIYRPIPAGMPEGPDCPVGVGDCPMPGSKPGAFKIDPRLDVETTDRFK